MLKEGNNNIKMLGLAPTHESVKKLRDIGIKAQTLKSFLITQKRTEKEQEKQEKQKRQEDIINKSITNPKINMLDNKLIILDEFSMIPNKDLAEFEEIISKSKAHAVFSGDIDQHLPIGSGKPVEITQKSNILKTVFLREIIRQKNPLLKEAVENVINKDYVRALDKIEQDNPQNYIERINPEFKLLKDHSDLDFEFFKNLQKSIIEIDNNELKSGEKTLEQMVAEDFLTRAPEVRGQTVVIVHANEDRAVITSFIRDGLKKQGVIAKEGVKANRLIAKGFTDVEHKSIRSYNAGDVLRFGNKYYHVITVDIETGSLLLKDGCSCSVKTRYFYPEKEADKYNLELYRHTKEELAIGDVIRLTKTDKKRSLFANFEYWVKDIDDKQAILESKNKENKEKKEKSQITLNHRKLKDSHWDYAQTVTGYGVQGASEKYAITFEVSYRKLLANVRSFYISISCAIEHLTIYTDNKSRFLQQLFKNKGDKYSALEVTGELEKLANNKITELKEIAELKEKLNTTIYDVKEIKQLLENQAEIVIERLLGKPNEKLSSSKEWRYGNKGSLVISLIQGKIGFWKNFETGESGNLIGLIQKELGLNFPETLKYASEIFGALQNNITLSNIDKNDKNQRYLVNNDKDKNTQNYSEKSKTSEYAQKLAKESLPITGTIVEKYLKEHRCIKSVNTEDIRYHPKVFTDKNNKNEKQKYLPAMLSIGRDKDGNVQCVQVTYLDPKTADKANLDIKKRTYASPSGALVSLQKQESTDIQKNKNNKNNKISFIAEGTETGLSIKDATRDIKNSYVVVTLGKSNFTAIDPESIGTKVVFCLDNDGLATVTDNTIHKAAERLISFGKEVFIAIPKINEINEKNGKNTKIDFNDIAKTTGIGDVRNMLENAIPYNEWKNNIKKIETIKTNEIDLSIAKRAIQQDNYLVAGKFSNLLPKKHEVDLHAATKYIDLEKNTSDKYLSAYNRMQNTLSVQKNITITKELNNHDIHESLSDTEREIH